MSRVKIYVQFSIQFKQVASYANNTQVDIVLPRTGGGCTSSQYSFTLGVGDAYQLQCDFDITGAKVKNSGVMFGIFSEDRHLCNKSVWTFPFLFYRIYLMHLNGKQ